MSVFSGAPMPKMKENSSSELTAPCNKKCNCGTVLIQPVCGSNNIAYFDPCHAGCLLRPTEDVSIDLHYFRFR